MSNMETEANKILTKFKESKITLDKARRLLFVLSNISNSSYCKLDRLKQDCSIAKFTNPKDSCADCGHYC